MSTAPRRESATALTAIARRHQLVAFFVLACAFSWWAWVWYRFDPVAADAPILAFGPFLAALVMLALVGGRPALRAWFAKIVHWRVHPAWYAFVLLVPPASVFAAVAIQLATGATLVPGSALPGAGAVAGEFAFLLIYIGLGEEPAWRGYALPRLMAGRSALAAAILLGGLHVVWHLPLFGRRVPPRRQPGAVGDHRRRRIGRRRVGLGAHRRQPAAADVAARVDQRVHVRVALVRRSGPAAPLVDLGRGCG
jgi:membrane protease YdiL (CAAX protease family)